MTFFLNNIKTISKTVLKQMTKYYKNFCIYCDKQFKNKFSYQKHLLLMHHVKIEKKEDDRVCQDCTIL